MKKKYVKIMFMSAVLLAGNVADANATLPKDDPKEAVQAPTDDHLPLLMINGTINLYRSLSVLKLYLEKILKSLLRMDLRYHQL